jgi:hypothetical protein
MNIWLTELTNIARELFVWIKGDYPSYLTLVMGILPFFMMSWILGSSLSESIEGVFRVVLGVVVPVIIAILGYVAANIYLESQIASPGTFWWIQWMVTFFAFVIGVLLVGKPLLGFGFSKTICAILLMVIVVYGGRNLGVEMVHRSHEFSQKAKDSIKETLEPIHAEQ